MHFQISFSLSCIRVYPRLILSHADIDTIEIRSDEEEGSGASKARRTYNYRVNLCLLPNLFYLLLFRLRHFFST